MLIRESLIFESSLQFGACVGTHNFGACVGTHNFAQPSSSLCSVPGLKSTSLFVNTMLGSGSGIIECQGQYTHPSHPTIIDTLALWKYLQISASASQIPSADEALFSNKAV